MFEQMNTSSRNGHEMLKKRRKKVAASRRNPKMIEIFTTGIRMTEQKKQQQRW